MRKFLRGAGLVVFSAFLISGFLYFQSNQALAKDIGGVALAGQSSSGKDVTAKVQDQEQPPENDQECENKKHPSGDKPDPNKIDCDCHPKCVDGKRVEDNTDCKKRCKPDKCKCQDPCPKT